MNAEQRAEATAVAVAVVVAALALWKLRIVIALLFFAITLAASMRPAWIGWPHERFRARSASSFTTSRWSAWSGCSCGSSCHT